MILGKKIEGFSYVNRNCSYCEREMKLIKVAHLESEPENYKALFYCLNPTCGAYDEEARKCYALVYYSTNLAYEKLFQQRIWMIQPKKK